MSDEQNPSAEPLPAPQLPAPTVERRRDWLPSLIWLIPIVAALVGITLVAKLLLDRGPEITLSISAESATVRLSGPMCSSVSQLDTPG